VYLRAAKADSPLANLDRVEEIDMLAGKLSMVEARKRVSETKRAIRQMERNVNARLLVEVLLLDWPK
jgi:hypothetical protein